MVFKGFGHHNLLYLIIVFSTCSHIKNLVWMENYIHFYFSHFISRVRGQVHLETYFSGKGKKILAVINFFINLEWGQSLAREKTDFSCLSHFTYSCLGPLQGRMSPETTAHFCLVIHIQMHSLSSKQERHFYIRRLWCVIYQLYRKVIQKLSVCLSKIYNLCVPFPVYA